LPPFDRAVTLDSMQFAGVLPEDAPDPRLDQAERAKELPVPVRGFIPQPSLEDDDSLALMVQQQGDTMAAMSVSVGYMLWRNPDDRADPVNLADLDDHTRRSLDTVPPWPRPAWLIAQVERMRYPRLWEAVRTSWHAETSERTTPGALLMDHARHILMNHFREPAGIDLHEWDSPAFPGTSAVRDGVTVRVEGSDLPGIEIDTDPFVYAVGAALPDGGVLTAVVPRDELPLIELAFDVRR